MNQRFSAFLLAAETLSISKAAELNTGSNNITGMGYSERREQTLPCKADGKGVQMW